MPKLAAWKLRTYSWRLEVGLWCLFTKRFPQYSVRENYAGSASVSNRRHVMSQTRLSRIVLLLFVLLACSPLALAQKKDKEEMPTGTPVMWREPADIESRNLLLGAGGEAMKPDLSKITFIKDESGGYSTKFRVSDGAGNEWVAKVGKESQSETASNRLLWAVGYETEIVYLAPKLTIEGKGSFENVRLEARPKGTKRTTEWSWTENPFQSHHEFPGLKIMMVLINNWDMKDANNKILVAQSATGEAEARYVISDLGGSFGKTGGILTRSRNNPDDFVKANLVSGVKNNIIDFHYSGKNKSLFENLTVDDARWIDHWLGKLSDEQLKDAFRAANYSSEDVDQLAKAVRERIDLLVHLGQ
jgi:hypothetical protein